MRKLVLAMMVATTMATAVVPTMTVKAVDVIDMDGMSVEEKKAHWAEKGWNTDENGNRTTLTDEAIANEYLGSETSRGRLARLDKQPKAIQKKVAKIAMQMHKEHYNAPCGQNSAELGNRVHDAGIMNANGTCEGHATNINLAATQDWYTLRAGGYKEGNGHYEIICIKMLNKETALVDFQDINTHETEYGVKMTHEEAVEFGFFNE